MSVQIYNPEFKFDYKLPTLQDYQYDLDVFKKFVNELVKLTSRIRTFMTEFLNHVYSSDWSYNYYLLENLLSFRELVDLINNRSELFDEIIAEKDAIMTLSIISPTEKYQTLGINVKKIYKRVQLPNNNFRFNIAKAREAKANYKSRSGLDISRNGGRLPVIGTIFKMCRTDKCETLEELRTTFFEEVERLVAYVQLYDIQTKNRFHLMMLFLAEQYKTNKIFTGVLSGVFFDLNEFYELIKILKKPALQDSYIEVWDQFRANGDHISSFISAVKEIQLQQQLQQQLTRSSVSAFAGGKTKRKHHTRNKRRRQKKMYKISIKNGRKRIQESNVWKRCKKTS